MINLSRRDFFLGGCSAIAVTLAPNPIDARFPRGAAPSGFNGGRSQVNLAGLQTSGEYPFLNALKCAQAWSWMDNTGAPVTPDILDSNGYPTSIVHGGVKTVFFVPTQAARPGNYVITWTGNGTIALGMANTAQGGTTLIGGGGSGRYVFATTASRFDVGISALPVSNLQVFHADDEAALIRGDVFGDKFKKRLIEANFGVIRFLNWNASNISNVTTWSTRKPAGYVFYEGYELRQSFYGGATTNSGDTYTCAFPPIHSSDGTAWTSGAPKDKDTIHVLFNANAWANITAAVSSGVNTVLTLATTATDANFNLVGETVTVSNPFTSWSGIAGNWSVVAASAGSVTINFNSSALTAGALGTAQVFHTVPKVSVNGTGAIKIYSEYTTSDLAFANAWPTAGTYASLATLTFDADINAWIKYGGDAAIGSCGILNGVPPELMVRLCAEVGAHMDFPALALTLTPATDYMTSLATYCRDNGPSWMIPRFEGPNELWNTNTYVTNYAKAKADAYGWTPTGDFHNWYGRALSTLGQAVAAVYGVAQANVKTQTKYQVLCGVQTFTLASDSDPRLSSAKYVLQTPQAGYTATAASNWTTHVRPANYVSPSEFTTNQEMLDAYSYSKGTTSVAATYVDTLASGSGAFNLQSNLTAYGNWKTWAQGFGVQKMSGYEGGYSPDYQAAINNINAQVPSPYSQITAATLLSTTTTLTLPTTFIQGNTNSNSTTPAASVGMAHIISGLGGTLGTTMNNPGLENVTIAGGNTANIGGANTLLLNQAVFFVADTMPNELTLANLAGASGGFYSIPYYVVSIGNPFQISATKGGAPILFNSVGSFVRAQECWFVTVVSGTSVTYDCNTTGKTFSGGGNALYANAALMLNNLRFAGKSVASLQTHTATNYANFTGLTGGGFVAEFPSCFQMGGLTPSGNVWSVLEDIYQTTNSPQWNAIVAYNH